MQIVAGLVAVGDLQPNAAPRNGRGGGNLRSSTGGEKPGWSDKRHGYIS